MGTATWELLSGKVVEIPLEKIVSGTSAQGVYVKQAVDYNPGEAVIRTKDNEEIEIPIPELDVLISHLMTRETYRSAFEALHSKQGSGTDLCNAGMPLRKGFTMIPLSQDL